MVTALRGGLCSKHLYDHHRTRHGLCPENRPCRVPLCVQQRVCTYPMDKVHTP